VANLIRDSEWEFEIGELINDQKDGRIRVATVWQLPLGETSAEISNCILALL
jgi:hypothetical protein